MVRRRQRERSLFEVLAPDGHTLWPEWPRRIDTLLEDEAVIEAVAQALEARWPQSRRRGRPGTPAPRRRRGRRWSRAIGHHARGPAGRGHDGPSARSAVSHRARHDQRRMRQMPPLVAHLLAQARARVVGGDTHVPDKALSVYEPHTVTIRKEKLVKPTEFGTLVTIQEAEHQYPPQERVPRVSRRWCPAQPLAA